MLKIIQIIQEEYREAHLDGESQSPYVAICTNPQVGVFQRISLTTRLEICQKIYTTKFSGERILHTHFTRPPVATVATNFKSAWVIRS